MLPVTTACTLVLREWIVLYMLTLKCASRHNGVPFHLSSGQEWLRTRRFSEPTFRPSGATNHWQKHRVLRLCHLFAHLHLLSSHSFSSLIFSLMLVSSLTLPTSAFPSVHIVGSVTPKLPKLPSIIMYIHICIYIYAYVYIYIYYM